MFEIKGKHESVGCLYQSTRIALETLLLEFNAQFVPSYHGAFCIFLTFLKAFNNNDTTNDTENNDSDNHDNDVRNCNINFKINIINTIFRMCCLS